MNYYRNPKNMNPLLKKMNYKMPTDIYLLNVPDESIGKLLLEDLDAEVKVHHGLGEMAVSFALGFVKTQAEVNEYATELASRAEGDATIWLAYPKGTSKKYQCDFNRDTGWAILGTLGFEGVRQVAIDEDWSALRFRKVAFIKTLARDNKRAMSSVGKERTQKKKE